MVRSNMSGVVGRVVLIKDEAGEGDATQSRGRDHDGRWCRIEVDAKRYRVT